MQSTYVQNLFTATLFGVMITFGSHALAEKITPSTVFQVTQDIIIQLNRMHDANFTTPDFTKTRLELPVRLPRHVLQQALNLRSKIQVLKRVNGIKATEIPAPLIKEVTPEDVLNISETILAELSQFDKPFGLASFKKQAKFVDGKTPTDVYANLLRAETMIIQLGIPSTVPNDVFNTAVSISQEIEFLRIDKGKIEPIEAPITSIGKTPSDAYTLAYYIIKGIRSLANKKEYTIPKGVIMPKRIRKDITPRDVQQLLIYSLAELSSIKARLGLKDKLVLPPPAAGKTPSSVVDQLSFVNTQIQSLLW